MTYQQGGLIQAQDYNGFVAYTSGSNINTILTNYNQTTLAVVNPAGIVTAAQWADLNTRIGSIATHQGTPITTRTNPVSGGIITALAALSTDLSHLNTNYLNAASVGTQYTAWAGNASLTGGYGSGGDPWTATFTDVITFSSAAAMTGFFNAGGIVRVQFSKTSTGTVADTEWNQFIPKLGTILLTGNGATKTIAGGSYAGVTKSGGSGTATIASTTGLLSLTSTPTTLFQQNDTGGTIYGGNYVQIQAQLSGSVITIKTYWHSDGDANPGSTARISGGTASSGITPGTAAATIVTYTPPESTYITNTWGTPTVFSSVA